MSTIKLPKELVLEAVENKSTSSRFSDAEHSQPEQKFNLKDTDSGRDWGYLVIDNTRRGPGLGGVRMAADITLTEVARLARVMTLKNSAANIPYGGGKSGLAVDPASLAPCPEIRSALIALFATAIGSVRQYHPAPDMGTSETDMDLICNIFAQQVEPGERAHTAAGRPASKGGIPLDEWGLTAHGLYAAALTLEQLRPEFPIKNSRVVVQGYGNVGSWTAVKLCQAGAILVGASDIHTALYDPDGLECQELNRIRLQTGGLNNYSRKTQKRFGPDQLDWLLEAPCDILIPAARPDAITSRNADRINCRVILQGANTPSNKMTEYYLKNRRGILSLSDFIVNVGGVIGCAVELRMGENPDYKARVMACGPRAYLEDLIQNTVSRNVREILGRLATGKAPDTLFRDAALDLARERLESPLKETWL